MKNSRRRSGEVGLLLDMLDEAFSRKAWHGPTLFGSLRGVGPEQASWRPAPGRHNIWEIVVHATYWKNVLRRRLTGDASRFPLKGSNWFARPAADRVWRQEVAMLVEEHTRLRHAVAELTPAELARLVHGRSDTAAYSIRGIAAHDLYHAGQIQLLKRLMRA